MPVISLATRVNCNGQHVALNAQTQAIEKMFRTPHYWKTIRGLEFLARCLERLYIFICWQNVKSGRKVQWQKCRQVQIKLIEKWSSTITRIEVEKSEKQKMRSNKNALNAEDALNCGLQKTTCHLWCNKFIFNLFYNKKQHFTQSGIKNCNAR